MKYHITPQQEYLLQGSITDNFREVLLHRLRGLCDNAETNPETFLDHEMVFALRKYNKLDIEKTNNIGWHLTWFKEENVTFYEWILLF